MNRAVSGTFVPGVKENIAYFTHAERRIMDSKAPPPDAKRETGVKCCPHERVSLLSVLLLFFLLLFFSFV